MKVSVGFATAASIAVFGIASVCLASQVPEKTMQNQPAPEVAQSSSFKIWRPHVLEKLRQRRSGNDQQGNTPGNRPLRGRLRSLLHRQPQQMQQ